MRKLFFILLLAEILLAFRVLNRLSIRSETTAETIYLLLRLTVPYPFQNSLLVFIQDKAMHLLFLKINSSSQMRRVN